MIEILPESHDNILGVRASDKLTDQDYTEVWIPRLEALLEEHGKIRCLLYMDEDFQGWDMHAMWDDAKFGAKHKDDIEKMAIVGGPGWVEWSVKLAAHFMEGEVKNFSGAQLEEAWVWLEL